MEQENCGCGIKQDSEIDSDLKNKTDCPYCGQRFPNPAELFSHVFVFHSC